MAVPRFGLVPAAASAIIAAVLLAGWATQIIAVEFFDYSSSRAVTAVLGLALATWVAAPIAAGLGVWGVIAGVRSGYRPALLLGATGDLISTILFAYTMLP